MTGDIDRDLFERLVRMETKLDAALQRSEEDRQEHDRDVRQVREEVDRAITEVHDDMDKVVDKVGTLENWRYAIGAALLMSAGSSVATVITAIPK